MKDVESLVKVNICKRDTEIYFLLSHQCESEQFYSPFRINTGDKSPIRRSYSVVAHHEALSRLRPGFKSRYEHFSEKTVSIFDNISEWPDVKIL